MNNSTTYYSAWDWLPWTVIVITFLVCLFSCMAVSTLLAVIIAIFFVLIEVAAFLGTYYVINNSELIVHSSFKVITYPINNITEIKPTNSWLAAPAASLGKRIAITFTDKGMLIISPAKQSEFISQLLRINPEIKQSVI